MNDDRFASAQNPVARPWDARLARWLVTPLVGTRVVPNHLTTLRLLVGLAGVALIAEDGYLNGALGMILVALASFLDHTDGELARLSGRISRWGHYYDLAVDALITVLLFVAVGVALTNNGLGSWAVVLGLLAGLSVSGIFYMRMQIEDREGKDSTRQAQWRGFETEDVLYLLPLVALSDQFEPFLIAAAAGAPLFALWVLRDYLRVFGRHPVDLDGSRR